MLKSFGHERNKSTPFSVSSTITKLHGSDLMKRLAFAFLIASFAAGSAFGQSCETRAVSKEGKPLSGAAKMSFIKKCKTDACTGKAVSGEGKPLSGAAKISFLTKCLRDA
jgi:hypothetical protein